MTTLHALKKALKRVGDEAPRKPLNDKEYDDGLSFFAEASGEQTHQENVIIPQLSELITSLSTRDEISVLEIGPGPESVLGYLPMTPRKRITKYVALEPSFQYTQSLQRWLSLKENERPLPSLNYSFARLAPFIKGSCPGEKYDVILFCHGLYGLKNKKEIIRHTIEMLPEDPLDGMVIIFHRAGSLIFDNLIKDDDEAIDSFSRFIVGYRLTTGVLYETRQAQWRTICRELAGHDDDYPGHLIFSSPEIMIAMTRHANKLPDLTACLPSVPRPPLDISQVQSCVRWALTNRTSLAILGGGHSDHCLWPGVVSVDMSAFDKVHVANPPQDVDTECWVVAEAGCKTGDIIRETMAVGVTVPLGSRPSVGAGLWLQGGIGHLGRHCGLACDAIVGAVMVDVISGQVLCTGYVPEQHRPPNAVRHEQDEGLLWALKGAGTNFGIVTSVTFKSYTAQVFSVRNYGQPNGHDAEKTLATKSREVSSLYPHDISSDFYLYCEGGEIRCGMTTFLCSLEGASQEISTGPPRKTTDAIELFDKEMYVSKMHAGHGGGKTSAFKRCVFLKDIANPDTIKVLISATRDGPTPYCYLDLVHGGKAVRHVAPEETAFGCRDWDFACVVTGIWPREYDGTHTADAVVRWVYRVVNELLPMSKGVYGADLGPDPRDSILATKAFGPNRRRLVKLKKAFDPKNILAYTCPLTLIGLPQKLVILVTGEHGAGKDYCAGICEVTKRKYVAAKGFDLVRLLNDRPYKEQHRKSPNDFYKSQLEAGHFAAENHFLEVLEEDDSDVLFITGMTETAPCAALSHLVQDARLIDVWVQASKGTRSLRRRGDENTCKTPDSEEYMSADDIYLPNFTFENEANGEEAVMWFANQRLIPFMSKELQNLAGMVPTVPNFPRQGIDFRYVLNIAQQKGGHALCTSLLKSHFAGNWDKVDAVVTSEASGYIFASPLALETGVPLVLITTGNKFPSPTVSVQRRSSHISTRIVGATDKGIFEMNANIIHKGNKVVVVDDVLATGGTLVAVLELLVKVGVRPEDISVMVVAELPFHRGRQRLLESAFGRVAVQSLLVFDEQ
ncbi:related to adenine phosphoribosyltransferase [Fusarium fujikuroi IMI 58289]|uniref:Related to adenine phosphoribosyltransferase n=1 Tax=Gibberella fujikuroi (strain CBS 195.34 / IMI 58289 / NRRL A-6831) TaxID=1279085 RepID=S0EI72_GIBF5|nr:related to adenine phosphoribosyltransferase [Fusarium fujikuroi IMI 58289]CCT74494.1 related to adenine phosphoribosyltransferase [Fusarium fujikuroi IMI 58289]